MNENKEFADIELTETALMMFLLERDVKDLFATYRINSFAC